MREGIDAVGFDLDGTLYPNYRFNLLIIPFILRELKFLQAFGKARIIMRSRSQEGSFYELQAEIMAKILK